MLASMTRLSGRSLIGFREGTGVGVAMHASNPTTGERLQPGFIPATAEEVELAVRLAADAFDIYRAIPGRDRGALLRKIAAKIESIAGDVVERAGQETALPQARLQGETARTCGQLRLFAQVAEEGSWVNARIDRADPERKPVAQARYSLHVAPAWTCRCVRCEQFPAGLLGCRRRYGFGTGGGQSSNCESTRGASRHQRIGGPSRTRKRSRIGLPEGVFSVLFGSGSQIGTALMKHPLVKAGGFTGSRAAGRILMDVAASRPEPIPFYAEMSSTNPVFVLPGALSQRAETIAAGLFASFTMGAGQFCTKPGMVFLPQGDATAAFVDKLQKLVGGSTPFHLLTKTIHSSYDSAIAGRKAHASVKLVAEGPEAVTGAAFGVKPVLFETDAGSFLGSDLDSEIFGPATLLVRHSSRDQVLAIARSLEGHLTATIHGTEQDLREFADLIAILEI